MASTLLSISGIGLPDAAARGIKFTIEPIEAAKRQRRTINGDLIDTSVSQFRKLRASASCDDQESPELTGVWPGMTVSITCLPDMIGTASDPLTLSMLVIGYKVTRDEWGAALSWQIDLEQV